MQKIKIQQFEGPLDLLLHLIEENELDISQISLANVTDQYIALLKQAEDINPDEISDFLLIAAKLLLIKSKTLLPQLAASEDDEGNQLEQQLKMYKVFLDASKDIQRQINKRQFSYMRDTQVFIEPVFYPPRKLESRDMMAIFRAVISNVEPFLAPPPEAIIRKLNIQEKINQIKEKVINQTFIKFSTLLNDSKSKMDIIVTFLALLELVKMHSIAVVQKDRFNEIEIKKYEERQEIK
ncbi:MAG: ScpA family protein [Patescibacteria group bacterium]